MTTETGTLKKHWSSLPWHTQRLSFISQRQETDGRKVNWYIVVDKEDPESFTWIKRKGNMVNTGRRLSPSHNQQHFTLRQNPRTGYAVLEECNLCQESRTEELEHNNLPTSCGIINKRTTVVFFCDLLNQTQGWRKKSSLEIPVDCRYLEEELKDQLRRNPKFIRKQISDSMLDVEIEDTGILVIEDNIESGEHRESIIKEYRLNQSQHRIPKFQFYTDGSMKNSVDHEKSMGAAWLQTEGPNQGNFFTAGVTDWPSPHRAELVAIILAILTVPQESEVEIVTDSASCISTYNRIAKPNPKHTTRRWIKEKNWSLWMHLLEIIQKKRLQVSFKKVKAYSGDILNDKVDALAKEERNIPEIIWKDPDVPYGQHFLYGTTWLSTYPQESS